MYMASFDLFIACHVVNSIMQLKLKIRKMYYEVFSLGISNPHHIWLELIIASLEILLYKLY